MRKFDYRVPRFSVDLPIRLILGDATHHVRCKEISTEGMKLEIYEPLVPGSRGALDLSFEDFHLQLPIQVTNSRSNFDGVKFIYESSEQRDAVSQLVASLTTPHPCTSLALLTEGTSD